MNDREFITIARIVKPQGRRGEVAAELHTDFPERFSRPGRVYALAGDGSRRELELEGSWEHKGHVILKFAGVDSIVEAEKLAGIEIQVPLAERMPLEPGAAYVSDLIGCRLVALEGGQSREVGRVAQVQFGAGEAPLLVVRGQNGSEHLIPYASPYLVRVETGAGEIVMALPEGMLELDAPLTNEEKQRQRGDR